MHENGRKLARKCVGNADIFVFRKNKKAILFPLQTTTPFNYTSISIFL